MSPGCSDHVQNVFYECTLSTEILHDQARLNFEMANLIQANGNSLHERRLRDSLELEREAVLDFMYTTVDAVSSFLTP